MGFIPQSAPFKKDPLFNRESFLRTPDWRWQEAKKIILQKNTGIANVSKADRIVLFAARLQQAFLNPATRQFIKHKMPDAWHVIQLGTADQSSALRAQLQACIISGLQPQKIQQKLHWISAIQATLYRDLFCDLSQVQGIPSWFQQMMLQPIRRQSSTILFRARAIAYYHSLDAAIKSIRFGMSGSVAREVMDRMWRDQRNKQVFDYFVKQTKIPIQVYVNNMQQAIKGRQDRDFIRESRQGQAEDTTIIQISKMLQSSVRGFTQAQTRLDTQKAKAGIDFSTEYTQHIKIKNGQKA